MLTVSEAKKIILENQIIGASESVPLTLSTGRYLCADVVAPLSLPVFDSSAMDGYALRSKDVIRASAADPQKIKVCGIQAAGKNRHLKVGRNECIRIMTGAPIPDDADAVVMQENVVLAGDGILVSAPVNSYENIRRAGEEIARGNKVLTKGQRITPAGVGFLAAMGIDQVCVSALPRVCLVATGNELARVGEKLGDGEIYESNSYALAAALACEGITAKVLRTTGDDVEKLEKIFFQALTEATHVLVTGGVSVGDFDFTRTALQNQGVKEKFWKVSQKPGKPLSYGVYGDVSVFGLPGNPASALICLYEYILPALRKYQGSCNPLPRAINLPLAKELRKKPGLTHFIRAILTRDEKGVSSVMPLGGQNSHMMHSFSQADGLIVLNQEMAHIKQGELVEYHPLGKH